MSNRLQYVAGASANTIELDGASIHTQNGAAGIRGRAWARELGYRNLLQANRPAREETLTVYADFPRADLLRRVADADVAAKKPGTLVFDSWKQGAYILECEPHPYYHGVMLQLTVALMDGTWAKLQSVQFLPVSEQPTDEYLDYPFDYEHDYAATASGSSIDTELLQASPVRLTVYGPATNPYVVVGGNRYQVNVTVPAGAYLVIDGRSMTIELVGQSGTVTDVFGAGERGSGQGGGAYVFQPLPPGVSSVSWDGSFGFDLGWYDLEGEPPWNLS